MLSQAAVLALLGAQCALVAAQSGAITSDSYFYGQSPKVAPPATGNGLGNWTEAYTKAKAFVAKLTLDEKVDFTAGGNAPNGCSGYLPPLERLNFPGMCFQDSGNSVRGTDFVSGYPAGLHVGASWNKELAYARGHYMAHEFRTKGVNVLLGPVVGPAGRVVEGGRNWEGFSIDPYLSGALVGPTVSGMQSTGVITSTKHYIANEQETDRNPSGDDTRQAVSSNIDDTTLHELYLWPFQEAVHAGTANIMCSYNRVNNSYGCQNSKTLNGVLKEEIGFQGFVVSDWSAQHAGVASAYSGLDVAMPNSNLWGPNLSQAVTNGSLSESRLDDMVTRILASWYQLGQDSPDFPAPGVGLPTDTTAAHAAVNARKVQSRSTILRSAIEGHVLIKNINNTLPLKVEDTKMLGIYGYDAKTPDIYTDGNLLTGWALGINPYLVSQLLCGYTGGSDCPPTPPITNQTLWTGGGSGASTPAYVSDPYGAINHYAIEHGIAVFHDFLTTDSTAVVDGATDACLVFINAFATESFDRPGLRDDFSDALVMNIADKCNNTIVVVHNAGIRLVDQWIDHPNVKAVLLGHVPGQDSGRAIVKLLFGLESPSGKLPYTIAKNETDYGTVLKPSLPEGKFVNFPQSNFSEGVYVDYRAFDKADITPRYEFGYGLSYTSFTFTGLKASLKVKSKRWSGYGGSWSGSWPWSGHANEESARGYGPAGSSTKAGGSTKTMTVSSAHPTSTSSSGSSGSGSGSLSTYPTGAVIPGGPSDLFDIIATVSATVKNAGSVTGAEVAQLYIGIPGDNQPVRQLRGFEKVTIDAGKSATVTFPLRRRDLSVWDVVAQKWKLQKGTYKVYVGNSSRKLPLTGTLTI